MLILIVQFSSNHNKDMHLKSITSPRPGKGKQTQTKQIRTVKFRSIYTSREKSQPSSGDLSGFFPRKSQSVSSVYVRLSACVGTDVIA